MLDAFLKKKWVVRQLDSRKLVLTESGKRGLKQKFRVEIDSGMVPYDEYFTQRI
ncbi:hypothetical protein [Xenorhabdus sp. PB62.4]|uniref:hypothetical protein n=1 Tax=Xenorhabdus sp. PB62.4 TaxID=1851573 RepID=UPI001657059D|nr:hypothetical protein [Xenorhabdus sp. PB62.4]